MAKLAPKAVKDKVMVYMSPEPRRGMAVLAGRGMRVSDLYAEAVAEYLQTWRRVGTRPSTVREPDPGPRSTVSVDDTLHRIMKRLDGHSEIIGEIRVNTASLVPEVDARALAIVIDALLRAGSEGIAASDVRSALDGHGFHHIKTPKIRDVLLQAGVVTYRDSRWFGTRFEPA